MAVGLLAVNLANNWLNMLAGTAFPSAPTNTYAKLHTSVGDPGASATANVSSVTTRVILAWGAAAAGSKAIIATFPSWTNWAGTSPETLGYISVWDNLTVGNVLFTAALTATKTVTTGDTFTLSSLTFGLTPLMA
jgi:hypothetical protein